MIQPNFKPDDKQLRGFGWGMTLLLPVLAGTLWWLWGLPVPYRWALLALAGVCALLAAVSPALLRPLYLLVTIVGLPIGLLVSGLVLRLVYYLVFTPVALFFRLRGRDLMQRSWDPEAETYWQPHRDRQRPRKLQSYLRLY